MTQFPDLAGKRAVVTGSTGVIGRWLVETLHQAGCVLCLTDARQSDIDAQAAKLGLTVDAYHAAIENSRGVRYESIDAVYSDHSEWFAADEEDAHAQIERAELSRALVAGLKNLPEREALVLQLYYVEELNLEEIGAVLEVGAARVCQIKKAALDRLRGTLGEWSEE